jgi:hypothetical protein
MSNRLTKGTQVNNTKQGTTPQPNQVKVDHGNAPLVTVHLLNEIRDLLKKLVEKNG